MIMLRRSSAWPAALQRLTRAVPRHRAASGNTNEAATLLDHWKRLLKQQRHGAEGPALKDEDVRQLLLTALRLRQGKAQSSVPEQLLSVFADCYRLMAPPQRLALFRSLTSTLGVQAHEVDTAAAAWQQLRQQQQQQQQQQRASSEAGLRQEEQVLRAAAQLSAAATPLFSRLFVPLSQQPCGIKLLVDMRGDLLQAIRDQPSGAAPLRSLADALRGCLAEWFSVGLLQLRQISWDASSAALLEKVAAGEAVHPIASWQDLRARLHPEDRRVFAFFHAAMPEEPLVVLHTALTDQVARSMRQLLPGHQDHQPSGVAHKTSTHSQGAAIHAEQSPADRTWVSQHHEQEQDQHHAQELPASEEHVGQAGSLSQPHLQQARLLELDQGQDQEEGPPSVAVFYSISSTQPGLAGVDLGNFLIKHVAQRVQAEFPSVTTLCTLSPLPGFASWLNLQLVRAAQGQAPAVPLLLQSEAQQLEAAAAVAGHVAAPLGHQQHLPAENPRQQQQQQQPQLQGNHQQEQQSQQEQQQGQQQRAAALLGRAVRGDAWLLSSCLEAAVQPVLLRLAAHYLLRERRRGLALDPVANFHLRNGAAVMQLNWRADVSKLGLQRSHGIMVNYHYELDRVQDNNRAYLPL